METATTAFRGTGPTEDQVRHFHERGWLLTRTRRTRQRWNASGPGSTTSRHGPMMAAGCITASRPTTVRLSVEVPAGSTLWFHSRTPHRSGPNRSTSPRRALYPTYNARSEGDLRAAYYREKLSRFGAGDGRADGMVQVSLIDDFQGRSL